MGYYSDVCLVLKRESYDRLLEAKETLNQEDREAVDFLLNSASDEYPKDAREVVLYWKSIKWYDSFFDVQFVTEFVQEEPGGNYKFIRVGEEADDVENLGHAIFETVVAYPRTEIQIEILSK